MKRKTKVIFIIFLIMLMFFSIYIYNEVQAKYILSQSAKISYTTSDYYFDVAVDTTEISAFPATLTVTAKNNDGTNYTNADLTYTIGVDNSNYTVTATGGNTRTITGGSKQEESYTITIEKTGTDDSESINLTFTVSKPYSDSKSIQIEVLVAELAPTNMTAYRGNINSIYTFKVTGSNTGSVWGTDIYTDDSAISKAAVHAGILAVGQTGIVKIKVLAGMSSYSGSTRNGITTSGYSSWDGSYSFVN